MDLEIINRLIDMGTVQSLKLQCCTTFRYVTVNMNLQGFTLIQRALMAAPNTLKDFKVLTKVSLNWKIHVENTKEL